MVIDSMLVYQFFNPDLSVEVFFKKEGTAEKWGVDFEIEDISTPAQLYCGLREISCEVCLLF